MVIMHHDGLGAYVALNLFGKATPCKNNGAPKPPQEMVIFWSVVNKQHFYLL